tara:strand:+ start:114 stop:308 length:195 start_codon:yes stop_codon:yes gene_type:complete
VEEAGEAALEVAQEEVTTQEGFAQAREDVISEHAGTGFKVGVHFAPLWACMSMVSETVTSRHLS